MKEKIDEYLFSINVSETVAKRVESIYDEVSYLFGVEDLEDALICEVNNNGSRTKEYTSLWFFSPSMAYECKNFMNADDYDVTPIKNGLVYFNFIKNSYDISKEPNDNSQVTINALSINGKITMNFHVTGGNCKYLLKIAKEYLLPNVKE